MLKLSLALLLIMVTSVGGVSAGVIQDAAGAKAPPGDKVSDKVYNYQRQSPDIATSGTIKPGGLHELKSLGFKTIVDLRTPQEGTADEQRRARNIGLDYHNIPISRSWPSTADFQQFKVLLENRENYPILLHCGSANRVGMMWAYFRIQAGIAVQTAIEEGRNIGMRPAREEQLKERLTAANN